MKITRVTYFALTAFVFAASCSKEAAEPDVYDWADGKIYFKTSLYDVGYSRAQDMTLDRLESFQVTCFNSADIENDTTGIISPYFENATFVRKRSSGIGTYESSPTEEPREWPDNDGIMSFFAFSPSLSAMTDRNQTLENADRDDYFRFINNSAEAESGLSVRYRLGNVRINPAISEQFDFVTAQASGERIKDFSGGVDLAFSHKLCQVELKAWGQSESYDFEIAGLRIGNPVVEGTFVFADDSEPDKAGKWEIPEDAVKDKIEYLFRSAEEAGNKYDPSLADKIFKINSKEHNMQESAASIMGNGGCAMVIPTLNEKWEGLEDPNIKNDPYTTDKMYFSVLMRVTETQSGNVVYPYPGNKSGMTIVSFAVNSSGNIVKRIYRGDKEGIYFSDPELRQPYQTTAGEEAIDFGWAAVPVDADWSAGKKYVYTLNYTDGIGLHDPEDPEPGKLIVGNTPIEWSVSISDWEYAEKDENFDPDVDVP